MYHAQTNFPTSTRSWILLVLLLTLGSIPCSLHGQEVAPWGRFPALSPDGSQLAFSFQGGHLDHAHHRRPGSPTHHPRSL